MEVGVGVGGVGFVGGGEGRVGVGVGNELEEHGLVFSVLWVGAGVEAEEAV